MTSLSSKDSALTTLLQKITPAQPAGQDTSEAGESTWSIAYFRGMFRRKALLIGILAVSLGAYSGFRAVSKVPLYQSEFRLLVEPIHEKHELEQLTDSKKTQTTQDLDYSSLIEVLYSPKLLEPIFKKVNQQYPGTDLESTVGRLSVTRLGETKIIEVGFYDPNPGKVQLLLKQVSQGYLTYSRDDQLAQLRQGIKFVEDKLPGIQRRVNRLQQEIQDLQQKFDFVHPDDRVDALTKQLQKISEDRQSIRTDLIALQAQYANLKQNAGALAALIQDSNYQASNQQYEVLARQLAIESARFGPNSSTIQVLKRQQENLAKVVQRDAEKAIEAQISDVTNQMTILTAKDRDMAQTEKLLKQQFQQMPLVFRQYTELQRELEIATDSLTRFLQTYQSLQIQASQNEIPWQLIEEAKSPRLKPTGSASKSIMSGFIGGLILGAIAAFILEKLENTLYTIDEVKSKIKLPLLGVIPLHGDLNIVRPGMHVVDLGIHIKQSPGSLKQVMGLSEPVLLASAQTAEVQIPEAQIPEIQAAEVARPEAASSETASPEAFGEASSIEVGQTGRTQPAPDPGNLLATEELEMIESALAHSETSRDYWLQEYGAYGFLEAFRTLYANIARLDKQPIRSIVINSALPGEGRTTVAIHLAQAAAAMGKRVLLVDAHLRKGGTQIHTLLGVPEHVGLGDYLMGNASLQQVVQSLSWESGLFLIGAGEIPLDPTRLLASQKMQDLMSELAQSFDLVIYDVLPLMGLADVKLLAAQSDGIMLVTSLGKRKSVHALGQTIERLNAARLPILGIVVNKAKKYNVDLYA